MRVASQTSRPNPGCFTMTRLTCFDSDLSCLQDALTCSDSDLSWLFVLTQTILQFVYLFVVDI